MDRVVGFLLLGALSDDKTGLLFTYIFSSEFCERSESRVRVPRTRGHSLHSHMLLSQPRGPCSCICIPPPKHRGPVLPQTIEFPFHRFVRSAIVRWRCSKPPPYGVNPCQIAVTLRPTVSRPVCPAAVFFSLRFSPNKTASWV
jgi:hypothetical protein